MLLYEKPSPFQCLAHHGVKGMKWGIRRTPEELGHTPTKPSLEKVLERDTIAVDDVEIHRSLGAKAKNYDILDPDSGDRFHFSEGTKIRDPKVFAGKGCSSKLKPETIEGLVEELGGEASEWQHCKGIGTIDCDGEERQAEVHWFQEPTVGKHKFKIKKWFD